MTLQQIAHSYNEYTNAFELGQISKEEYRNLLEGLEVEKVVSYNAEELHYKEQLHTAITAAIAIASAVA